MVSLKILQCWTWASSEPSRVSMMLHPKNKEELIESVSAAYDNYPRNKINQIWLTLQCCFNQTIIHNGDNDYSIDHIAKEKLEQIRELLDVMDVVEDMDQIFDMNNTEDETEDETNKGTFCIQSKEEVEKQVESLACWFEQKMELGDASFKEAPTTNPSKKDLTKNEWLEAISMLVMMETEDHLQRGAIMKLTKRFNMACSTVYGPWEHVGHTHAMGIVNTPELASQKKFWENT